MAQLGKRQTEDLTVLGSIPGLGVSIFEKYRMTIFLLMYLLADPDLTLWHIRKVDTACAN